VRHRCWCLVLLSLVLAACGPHSRAAPSTPPPAPPSVAASGLQVALLWSAPVDLDLYVTDPTWETAYFANNPSGTGARLLHDTGCGDVAAGGSAFVETTTMTEPLPGPYRVGVDFIDACNAPNDPVSFRVVADYAGMRREATGTIRLEEFHPIVVEFELQRSGPDGTLSLVQPPNGEH
jgi:hypothetical protein